jgi:membrane associated rhomboid family serine protease
MRWTGCLDGRTPVLMQIPRPSRIALVLVFALLGFQWWPGLAQTWVFSRTAFLQDDAWWLLLTSQWVHLNWLHAVVNAAGMGLLVWTLSPWVNGPTQLSAAVGGYGGVALVLALDPNCAYYAGASGALHGLLAGSGLALLLVAASGKAQKRASDKARARALGAIVLLVLVGKLLWQRSGGLTGLDAQGSPVGWLGIPTYTPAHEAGALGGLVGVALYLAWRHYRNYRTARSVPAQTKA